MDNKIFRVVCIHLDKDRYCKELDSVFNLLKFKEKVPDIILGDFNHNICDSTCSDILTKHNFIDCLNFLKNEKITHPFGILDHILVRNATPIEGKVLDYNILEDGVISVDKFNQMLEKIGSDHFIVLSTILI